MPLGDRDYIRGRHPPACTCAQCARRRNRGSFPQTRPRRRATQYRQRPTRNAGKIAALIAFVAAIALVLFSMFLPVMAKWVDDAQAYMSRFRQGLAELQRRQPIPDENQRTRMPDPTSIPEVSPDPGLPNSDLPATKAPVILDKPDILSPDPEIGELRNYMVGLINEDRRGHGLAPVVLGDNVAAQQHAEDKLRNGYGSHWGMDGLTPYMRYTLAGGVNYEAENGSDPGFTEKGVRYREQSPRQSLKEAQEGLMNSPGHRRNILNKWHKKVNLGIVCNRYTCSVVQQFEGDYVEFSREPAIIDGILSFEGNLKGGFSFDGVDVRYDQPPHPLTLGQLDATYSYSTGQLPATFLSEPLSGGYYYQDSSTTFTWESGVDPYFVDPSTPRSRTPPPQTITTRSRVVPWTTAKVWDVSGQFFRIETDISSVINELGPGVYTVLIWGDYDGESVPLTNYSIFRY